MRDFKNNNNAELRINEANLGSAHSASSSNRALSEKCLDLQNHIQQVDGNQVLPTMYLKRVG